LQSWSLSRPDHAETLFKQSHKFWTPKKKILNSKKKKNTQLQKKKSGLIEALSPKTFCFILIRNF